MKILLTFPTLCLLIFGVAGSSLFADMVVNIGASKDNTMFEAEPNNSNGAGSYFFTGRTGANNGGALVRGLLSFDIAGNIPENSTINSVSLQLHLSQAPFGGGTQDVGLHVVSQDWGEAGSNSDGNFPGPGGGSPAQTGDATWEHTFYSDSFWTNNGGDFAGTASATQAVGTTVGFFEWSGGTMVSDVQQWLDNPQSNFGWAVIGDESGPLQTAKRFDSHENTNADFRPLLTVDYTAIPEPSSGLLTGLLLSGLWIKIRRRHVPS